MSNKIKFSNNILNFKTNNKLKKDKVVISISKKNKISLEEKFKNYKGENLAKEFSWDGPLGTEIW